MNFSEIKNRDAWSTIRGFVYQVDVTIQRWLALEPNQQLELEKGEDIDIVKKGINGEEIERELEQIKYRESNATLNQEWVLEILLNFYVHRKNNPDKRLYFRYVTNSGYGQETPSIFSPLKQKGIDAWNSISETREFNESIKLIQDKIKLHLQKKIKSQIIESKEDEAVIELNKNWSDFHDYIENDENIYQFITDFQWSFHNDDETGISVTIKKQLEIQGFANNSQMSEEIYSRLFLYVFKKLCSDTAKTLNSAELKTQMALPDLSPHDSMLQTSINELLFSFNERLNALEDEVTSQKSAISALIGDVAQIQGSDTVFDYRLNNLMITPPRLVKNGSKRSKKVVEILGVFEQYTWINIQGINGTGKSQLASSIYHSSNEGRRYWLDLRAHNNSPEKTVLLLEAYLVNITTIVLAADRDKWADEVSKAIPEKSLIILNDLPHVEANSALCSLLCGLAEAFAKNNIKIITTSNYEIPSGVQRLLNPSTLTAYSDLDFTNEEIIEYFNNHGANQFISTYVNLIALLSHRNPSIIGSILWYLEKINWGGSTQAIEGVLRGEFSKEILDNAQLLVSKNITDQKSRELLYRLSLVHWEFELELVKCISSVPEEITHPNEKLIDLLNIWIQGYDSSYQISPLIYNLGKQNLSESVVQLVHISIAESILSTKKINQINAARCINSFLEGKDYNRAGMTLLTVYNSALDKSNAEHLRDWGYLNYWSQDDIPNQMNFTLRVQLRLEQARLSKLLKKDDSYYYSKLKEYSFEREVSISDRVLAHIAMLQNYDNLSLSDFWYHFKKVAENYNSLDKAYRDVIRIKTFVSMLWFPVTRISSDGDVKAWLDLVNFVKNQFAIDLLKNKHAQMALTLMSNQVVNRSSDSKGDDWSGKLQTLSYLKDSFEAHGYEKLSAVALKQIITIEFEINNDVQKAIEITNAALLRYGSIEAQYLLCANIGRMYFLKKDSDEAIRWLSRAVDYNCDKQPNFIETVLNYATVLSPLDNEKALIQCVNAMGLAESNRNISELFHLKVLGELGISYWLNNDLSNCFETFELLITRLFAIRDTQFGDEWVRVLKFTGHALGYIAGESNGSTPEKVKGDEEYVRPYQGLIALSTGDVSDIYEKKNDPIIMAQLAMLAGAIGNIEKASGWSQRAFDFARSNGEQGVFMLLSSQLSKYLVLNYKVAEAIETSILYSAVTYHIDEFESREDAFDNANLIKLYESKPSEKWNHAEHAVVTYTVIPLFIRTLLYRIENPEQYNVKSQEFISSISDYYNLSSDKQLWEELIYLATGILNNTMPGQQLFDRVIENQQRGWSSIQTIGILGLLANTSASEKHLEYLLNFLPQIVNAHVKLSFNVISNIVAPFVKAIGVKILKTIYVGDRQTLNSIIVAIESVDTKEVNCIQKIIIPIIDEVDIEIPADRKSWLYE